jgi:hypothetical protein
MRQQKILAAFFNELPRSSPASLKTKAGGADEV